MFRPKLSNHSFERMGEAYAPLIDRDHFLGRSAFDIPYESENKPPVNFKHDGEIFELSIMVPGFAKNELKVTVEDDILIIKGEKVRSAKENETSRYIIEEFNLDSFERRFRLSEGVGHEKIVANYQNGILKLRFFDVPGDQEQYFKSIQVE